jgi:hypothetical protein
MVAWFAAGIAASLAVVNVRIVVLDLVRPTGLNVLVKQLAQTPRDRPILMLIGSSFTFLGLDTAQLEAELAAKGRSYRVVKFAAGGVSSLERLRYLRRSSDGQGAFAPPSSSWRSRPITTRSLSSSSSTTSSPREWFEPPSGYE